MEKSWNIFKVGEGCWREGCDVIPRPYMICDKQSEIHQINYTGSN